MEDAPKDFIIKRLIRSMKGYKGFSSSNVTVLGMRALFLRIQITPGASLRLIEKRIRYACGAMAANHVGKVLFSKNFLYSGLILREGFVEMESSSLYEALAGKIATFAGTGKYAALFAKRLTGSALTALNDLCAGFRYVMLESDSDGGGIVSSLGRRYGISVILHPTAQQLNNADTAVFFDPPRCKTVLPDKCIIVAADKRALDGVVFKKAVAGLTIKLAGGKAINIPENFPKEPLLAMALYAGTIGREEMILQDIVTADRPVVAAHGKTGFIPEQNT